MANFGPELSLESGFLIAGKWISAGLRIDILSPYDGKSIGSTWVASRKDLESALSAAAESFAEVRQLAAHKRKEVLLGVASSIRKRRPICSADGPRSREASKPARAEVDRAVLTFITAAEEAVRIYGEYLPLDLLPSAEGCRRIVRRFPVGPIAAITPFNFPLNLVAHKLAPAIAVGCPVVLKPAPQTPFCALLLAKLILRIPGSDEKEFVTQSRR